MLTRGVFTRARSHAAIGPSRTRVSSKKQRKWRALEVERPLLDAPVDAAGFEHMCFAPTADPFALGDQIMKLITSACLLAVLTVACDKSPSSSSAETTSAPKQGAVGATPAAPAKAPFVQKGVPEGKIVVGYIQDTKESGQCAVVTDKPENKEEFKKNGDKIAAMFKGKVVASCPTDQVVGTCNAGFGLLNNYYAPTFATDTAKADCEKSKGKWVD